MAAAVSSVPRLTFFANDGEPLSGGLVYVYAAGTGTAKTIYSNEAKTIQITNPMVLNAAGRPIASATDATEVNLYYSGSAKFVIVDSLGSTLYTADNVEEVAPASGGILSFPVTITGGVSGGIPYFSSTTVMAASAIQTQHAVMVGGGAAAAPATIPVATTGQLLGGVTGADPAFASAATLGGSLTLLKQGSGNTTSGVATNLDTVAITGLTVKDRLVVEVSMTSTTQATGAINLYDVTDSAVLTTISGITVNTFQGWRCVMSVFDNSSTAVLCFLQGFATDGILESVPLSTLTAGWTNAWTLALRQGGVTAGGTCRYNWAVYKLAGQ